MHVPHSLSEVFSLSTDLCMGESDPEALCMLKTEL